MKEVFQRIEKEATINYSSQQLNIYSGDLNEVRKWQLTWECVMDLT